MDLEKATLLQKLIKTFELNPQTKFGSYAAELSFYIIWAIIPLLLAFANIIAVLPVEEAEILTVIEGALPQEVARALLPILETYLSGTSSGAFSLGLIISLWPASNVFNTVQRILNTVFKASPRKNAMIARVFAYIFTLAIVLATFSIGIVLIFGEWVLDYLNTLFGIEIPFLSAVLQNSGLIGFLGLFTLMFCIYYFMPNVKWDKRYAAIGAVVATIGFLLISQLFTVYMSFNNRVDSNTTIGIFIVVIIWLYYNMMVIAIGAYVSVFIHDLIEVPYWQMVEITRQPVSFYATSDVALPHTTRDILLKQHIVKK